MKYVVGDKVRVKEDLISGRIYDAHIFVYDMKPYMGKTMTISRVRRNSYYLKEDKDNFCWTDEMLEDVDMDKIEIIVDGNKVIAKKGNKVGIAKCSPEDEFDIFTGAKLAIDRLEEKCKPYGWLKDNMKYYYPCLTDDDLYGYSKWYTDAFDEKLKERGLIFKTKEEAIEVAKKMLEVVK